MSVTKLIYFLKSVGKMDHLSQLFILILLLDITWRQSNPVQNPKIVDLITSGPEQYSALCFIVIIVWRFI